MSIETLKKLSDVFGMDLLTDYHRFKMDSARSFADTWKETMFLSVHSLQIAE